MIIGVDIDGVLANYYQGIKDYANENGLNIVSHSPVTYGMVEEGCFGSKEEFLITHKNFVAQGGLGELSILDQQASQLINNLYNDGHTINIITAREVEGVPTDFIREQTENWLDKHNFKYHKLIITHDKHTVDCDVYIDDSPYNYATLSSHDKLVYLYDSSYNVDVDSDNRVESFKDFVEKISSC